MKTSQSTTSSTLLIKGCFIKAQSKWEPVLPKLWRPIIFCFLKTLYLNQANKWIAYNSHDHGQSILSLLGFARTNILHWCPYWLLRALLITPYHNSCSIHRRSRSEGILPIGISSGGVANSHIQSSEKGNHATINPRAATRVNRVNLRSTRDTASISLDSTGPRMLSDLEGSSGLKLTQWSTCLRKSLSVSSVSSSSSLSTATAKRSNLHW